MDYEYRCKEVIPLFQSDAFKTIRGLDFYLQTLEQFINEKERQEVSDFKRHADHLPAERQGEFWAWHYPVHWKEIFASQLRSSFIVSLVSIAESHVGMVSEQALKIAQAPLKPRDLRGGFFERHRTRLETFADFQRPSASSWDGLCSIRDIRNCIVHASGRLFNAKNKKRLYSLVDSLPGLTASYDVLEFAPEFPAWAIGEVRTFIDALYEEAADLCVRIGISP